MSWVMDNVPQTLIILGLLLLAVEILVLGFSTFVLFFVGISAVASGGLLYLGIVEPTLLNGALLLAGLTLVSAASLWQPLKKMQQQTDETPAQNDLIGYEFLLEQDITASTPGSHHYSGITWAVHAEDNINKGSKVKVSGVQVGRFDVIPA